MQSFAFGVQTTPPLLNSDVVMQRVDDVGTIQQMLTDAQTRTVMLVGDAGVGKSTLAALIYHRLLIAQQANMSAPRYLVWITINKYTTLSDILDAILQGIEVQVTDFRLLPLEQQISLVQHTIQQLQENALFVLDQFEELLALLASNGGLTTRELQLLLALLQTDEIFSRFLLTSTVIPFDEQRFMERIRVYQVASISIPEGLTLLQQNGVKGTPEELSLVWERCSGHVFALLLYSSLIRQSGIAPGYLLLAGEYQPLWSGNIPANIFSMLYQYLSPLQKQILLSLSLFSEPVSLEAIAATVGSNQEDISSRLYAQLGQELQTLLSLSLVQSLQDSTLDAFFSLHPLLIQCLQMWHFEGNEQLEDPYATQDESALQDESRQIVTGHIAAADYYYAIVQQQELLQEQRTRLQDIEPLLATIRHLCLGQQWQPACNLLFKEGVHESLVRWGAWRTLITLYITLVPPLGMLDRHDVGLIFSHLAMLYGRLGNVQQSQTYAEQALAIQRETEDTYGEATTLANQGELCRIRGEHEQAHMLFEKAMILSRQQPDQQRQQEIELQCILLHNMGMLYYDSRDFNPALSCYLQALRLSYTLRNQYYKGTILTNLGMLLFQQGQQREGVALLLAALQLRKMLHDPNVVILERFFAALEQRFGTQSYMSLCQAAQGTDEQVLARLMQVPA